MMRAQKDRRAVEKALIILENTYNIMNRILEGIWTLGLLVKCQREMKSILLGAGGKTSLSIK